MEQHVLVRSKISAFLASAAAGGTIAATRNLGASGIDVRVISSRMFCAAAWSRYVSRTYSVASEGDGDNFLKQLLEIGAAEPGHVLLPTSDHTAWLYAENAALLGQYFLLNQPPLSTLRRILDKKLLAEAASQAGLAVLRSWCPQNIDELAAYAPSLCYPILIKPRTQVHRRRNDKGVLVHSAFELKKSYQSFIEGELGRNEKLLAETNVMLQQFVSNANEAVHSITGFVDRTGELFVTRHAAKVLQRLEPVGVGVCFESLPEDPSLTDDVRRLCKELGFFGIFEVEFVWFEGRWNIIDFNPRIFSQVALDIRRGLPLPLLAYLDAVGDAVTLRKAVEDAQAHDDGPKVVFYDRFTLTALLQAKSLTSRISPWDLAYWRAWRSQNDCAVDFAADSKDRMPGFVHIMSEIMLGLMALPRFLRLTPQIPKFLNQPTAKAANEQN
jgi:D-aspartate ligase